MTSRNALVDRVDSESASESYPRDAEDFWERSQSESAAQTSPSDLSLPHAKQSGHPCIATLRHGKNPRRHLDPAQRRTVKIVIDHPVRQGCAG